MRKKIIDILKTIRGKMVLNWRKYFNNIELIEIQNYLQHLNIYSDSFDEIRACYIYEITERPKCPVCGKPCEYNRNRIKKYKMFCSIICEKSDEGLCLTNKKSKISHFKKYGKEHYQQTDDCKKRKKKTCADKYGVENVFLIPEIKSKANKTILERYGVENVFSSDEIKDKIKQTSFKKYKTEYPSQCKEVKDKIKQTSLKKYKTNTPSQCDEIKTKTIESNLEKYGVEYYTQTDENKHNHTITARGNYYSTFILMLFQKHILPLFSREDYINYDYDTTMKKYKCLICNKDFEYKTLQPQKIHCPHHKFSSKAEHDIKLWIEHTNSSLNIYMNKKYYISNIHHEVDIFLPDYNIGIEHHGLYWHSELRKDVEYHRDKYLFFKEMGIKLIQVFENEWINKQEIVKSIILTQLGLISNRVHGRQCDIKTIKNDEYKQFCELNHIQGYAPAKIRLGLYHNDELVQIMSFSKSRFNKKYDWENIRTCTKLNTVVVGGFSKLLKHFRTNYTGSIITYVDCRYFSGGGYIKNGFKLLNHTSPNYFYFKNGRGDILETRNKYQKHKLKDILPIFDENLTEHENMLTNKFLRIYDAGNLVMVFD